LFLRIRGIVAEHHGLPTDAIVVMKRGGILKTSSGKLQRRACREAFLSGKLNELASWRSPDPADRAASPGPVEMRRSSAEIRIWLCHHLGDALGIDPQTIDHDRSFAEYGL